MNFRMRHTLRRTARLGGVIGTLLAAVAGGGHGTALAQPATSGAPADGADFIPLRYDLDVFVDYDEGTLRGTVDLALRNRRDRPSAVVPVLLHRLMTIRAVYDGSGAPLAFTQDVVRFADEPRLQVTRADVRLPAALAPGDSARIRLVYDGYLTGYQETGALYIRDAVREDYTVIRMDAFAYPQIGVPSRASNRRAGFPEYEYTARIDVPAGYVVANGGTLEGRETREGRETWSWRSRAPSWRMDFAIARYGTLDFEGMSVFYLPGDSLGAVRLVRAAREAHRRYSDWFGPLERPLDLTIIEVPDGFGSQKDATTILQTASAFRDSSQLRQMYHEVAHGWTPLQSGLSPRVEEGLATFLEYRLADELDGGSEGAAARDRTLANLREWFGDRPEFAEVPMASYGERSWTSLSYSVGFLMYAVLYEVIGADRFDLFVGEYARCCPAGGPSTERLAREIEEVGGPAAHEILQDWLWTTDWWPMVRDGWTFERIVARYRKGGTGGGGTGDR